MLRPVDRIIRHQIEDANAVGKISLLKDLCNTVGAKIRRGGKPDEIGFDARFLNNIDNFKREA